MQSPPASPAPGFPQPIDGLDIAAVEKATAVGVRAACIPGIRRISAGNYGGTLGQFQVHLHRVLEG